MLAQFEAWTDAGDRRGADRRPLRLAITATLPQNPELAASIHDLSETGFLLETRTQLAADQQFQIFLPLAGAVEARVVWTSAHFYGCQFREPVARAAVSAALLKSVPLAPAANAEPHPDLISQLRDMNARIEQIGSDLDRAIADFAIARPRSRTTDPDADIAAALPRSAIRPPPEAVQPTAEPRRYYEPLPSGDGDTVKWAVIASLILAGLAALMLIAALLGMARA
ncbi:MAG: PilZ domain-containing protein [Sphingomicrobium sp.]